MRCSCPNWICYGQVEPSALSSCSVPTSTSLLSSGNIINIIKKHRRFGDSKLNSELREIHLHWFAFLFLCVWPKRNALTLIKISFEFWLLYVGSPPQSQPTTPSLAIVVACRVAVDYFYYLLSRVLLGTNHPVAPTGTWPGMSCRCLSGNWKFSYFHYTALVISYACRRAKLK